MKAVLFNILDFTILEKVAMAKYLGLTPYLYVYTNRAKTLTRANKSTIDDKIIILLEDKGYEFDAININTYEFEDYDTYEDRFEDDIDRLRFDQNFIRFVEQNSEVFINLRIQEISENRKFMIHKDNADIVEVIRYYDTIEWMILKENTISDAKTII